MSEKSKLHPAPETHSFAFKAKSKRAKVAKLTTDIDYLEQTLIPDLKKSGMTATAEDVEMCVKHMKTLRELFTTFLKLEPIQ